MSAPFIIPFNQQPVSTLSGDIFYTIPSGKYACVNSMSATATVNGNYIGIVKERSYATVSSTSKYIIISKTNFWTFTWVRASGSAVIWVYFFGYSSDVTSTPASFIRFNQIVANSASGTIDTLDFNTTTPPSSTNLSYPAPEILGLSFANASSGSLTCTYKEYDSAGTIWLKEGDVYIGNGHLMEFNAIS